jgi:hypothetical protein
MVRFLLLFLSCLLSPKSPPAVVIGASQTPEGLPGRNTPKELTEAWLRFHEAELCQGIDAVFVFKDNGMEVRGRIEDESAFQKFEAMLQPLRGSHKVELHLDRRQEEKTPGEKREMDPPASLWENYELRSFLGDPAARARERIDFEEDSVLYLPPPADMLKQRLLIYADQVLEWNRKIERYAKHVSALTRVARDPGLPPGLHTSASVVAMAHARNMEKFLSKLNANLEHAFPRFEKRDRTIQPEKAGPAPKDITDFADQVADYAHTVSQRVSQFIHPEHYTVGLDELRRPGLLEDLKTLQKMNSDFQKVFAKTR